MTSISRCFVVGRKGALLVGASFLSFTRRWASPGVGGSGKNPSRVGAEHGAAEAGDDTSSPTGALTKCPGYVTADEPVILCEMTANEDVGVETRALKRALGL